MSCSEEPDPRAIANDNSSLGGLSDLVVPALETHMLLGRRPGALSIAARSPRPDFSDQASKEGG